MVRHVPTPIEGACHSTLTRLRYVSTGSQDLPLLLQAVQAPSPKQQDGILPQDSLPSQVPSGYTGQ